MWAHVGTGRDVFHDLPARVSRSGPGQIDRRKTPPFDLTQDLQWLSNPIGTWFAGCSEWA